MKLEIFEQSEKREQIVTLRLRKIGNDVLLVAVDSCGFTIDNGILLILRADGSAFTPELSPSLGFSRNMNGALDVKD